MLPGMNERALKQAMKKMGMQQEEVPAESVIIKMKDKEIIISNPSVQKLSMMGQESFQVTGIAEEKALKSSEEDAKTVSAQAGVSEEEAKQALEEAGGDLAQAIINLKK